MSHKTLVGDIALKVLAKIDSNHVMWGDCDVLDNIARLADPKKLDLHPMRRWQYVLNALERDERFEKRMVNGHVGTPHGWQARKLRSFWIRTA